jgi:hypothetical protein
MKTTEANDIQKSIRNQVMGPVITKNHVYFNDVHAKWFPVPAHWVGLHTSEVSDRVVLD